MQSDSARDTPATIDLETGQEVPRQGAAADVDAITPQADSAARANDRPKSRARIAVSHTPNVSVRSSTWIHIQRRLPKRVSNFIRKIEVWMWGPIPPRKYSISPFFEPVQTFPNRMFRKLPRSFVPNLVLLCVFALWVACFVTLLHKGSLPGDVGGFGAPVRLACISRLWHVKFNATLRAILTHTRPDATSCGLDGRGCLPFDDQSFAFSCPSDCSSARVLNPYAIGNESVIYQSLVIGGTPDNTEGGQDIYRGDSFICGAAIHAGAIDDGKGGCAVLSLVGGKSSYGAIGRNGIQSVGFDSDFPLSFVFDQSPTVLGSAAKCGDPRWNALGLTIVMTVFFSLVTQSPGHFFFPVFIMTFFQIAMASDPPPYIDYASLASTAIGSFLPAMFVMTFFFYTTIRKTLSDLTANIEKTVLWVGALWVGALNNLTFDHIPISSLTSHTLKQQPGAIVALIIIIIVLLVAILGQAWLFRKEGRLCRYLGLYLLLGLSLLVMLKLPQMQLRIHHYFLALLLLPGTAIQTRLSLLYQGLLVGLFINGVARWGFASVLETSAQLQGDALLGSGIPIVHTPNITSGGNSTISFTWEPLAHGWDGISVLVNDVERFRGFHRDGDKQFNWTRQAVERPEYFRFGFVNYVAFGGAVYSDFTKAGVWGVDGSWSGIPAGST
jgi:hypothetical protein